MRILLERAAMPTETELRDRRQREILTLLRRRRVASQGEIVSALQRRGVPATQPSVSRDLQDLGIVKVAGRYVTPPLRQAPPQELAEAVHFIHTVRAAGPHLSVVLTVVGSAQTVALALDHASFPEVVGTLAGDDTIFVATATATDQKLFLQRLEALLAAGTQ
jgi:transcriptional regulator of arginine metabolism